MVYKSNLPVLIYSLLFILIDQGIKKIVYNYLPTLIVFNYHGAWGIIPSWMSVIGLVGLIWIILYKKVYSIPYILILSGGISNIIDRFIYQAVVDFIHIWIFPVFNIADIYIMIGVLVWLTQEFFNHD